jgi:hypothetical protein
MQNTVQTFSGNAKMLKNWGKRKKNSQVRIARSQKSRSTWLSSHCTKTSQPRANSFLPPAWLIPFYLKHAKSSGRFPTPLHQPHHWHKADLAVMSQEACGSSAGRLGKAPNVETSCTNGKNARTDGAWSLQGVPSLNQARLSQPRGEHGSKSPGGLRLHWKVEIGQGELFLGFPRQFTALFYTKKLNAITICDLSMSRLYNFVGKWFAWWCVCRSDGGLDGTEIGKIEATGME